MTEPTTPTSGARGREWLSFTFDPEVPIQSEYEGIRIPDHPALPKIAGELQRQTGVHPREELTATVWRVELAKAAADWLDRMSTLVEDDGFEEFAPDAIASFIRWQLGSEESILG